MPTSCKVLVHRALFYFSLLACRSLHCLSIRRRKSLAKRLLHFSAGSMDGREAGRLARAIMLHKAIGRLDELFPAAASVELTESARLVSPAAPAAVLPTLYPRALRLWRPGARNDPASTGSPPRVIIRVERPGIFRCAIRAFPVAEGAGMGTDEFRSHLRSLLCENPTWFEWETDEISELFSATSRGGS